MIWIYTDTVTFQVESVLAIFDMFEFIFVKVRPPPQSSINHMRKTLATSHLERWENMKTSKGNTKRSLYKDHTGQAKSKPKYHTAAAEYLILERHDCLSPMSIRLLPMSVCYTAAGTEVFIVSGMLSTDLKPSI